MVSVVNEFLWGRVFIVALIALGLIFTVSSRFVQLRYFGRMFGILKDALHHEKGHVSSFQALALSVAGRVGAGNIAGVAVAITLGGPGAVFWMWVTGLIGMATSLFEASLAQLFKTARPDGTYHGGPAYYISRGLRHKGAAILFSVLLLITFGFCFNALQAYTMAASLNEAFAVPGWITGAALTAVLALIVFGGVRRIVSVAEIIVPIMAVGYLAIALVVVVLNIADVPAVLALIVKSAFGLEEAVGGGIGAALSHGIRRGLFSNEAGLGSAPNVAALAHVGHPVAQGVVQSFSVFVDTLIICTCTAAIILFSGVFVPGGELTGVALTQTALAETVGQWGRVFVSITLVLAAFTSSIYNYYLGENAINFMREDDARLIFAFRLLFLAFGFWGAVQNLATVYVFADLAMGLLALVNLIALALLLKISLRLIRDYDRQIKAGRAEPVLDPRDYADLAIDREAWPAPRG